jgi:hypothetical protein
MRTVPVVVSNVLSQHRAQLPAADDQHSDQHLPPNRADPPLGEGVRPRWLHRRAQHPDPFAGEDRVERGSEPRVTIADQESEPAGMLAKLQRFRACWVTHAPAGCRVRPRTWTRRVASSMTNSTYSRLRNTVSTVKKSVASTPLPGCGGAVAR